MCKTSPFSRKTKPGLAVISKRGRHSWGEGFSLVELIVAVAMLLL